MQVNCCKGCCHTGLIPSLHSYTRVNARIALSLCAPADWCAAFAFTFHEAVFSSAMSSNFGTFGRTTALRGAVRWYGSGCICIEGWYSQRLGSILQSRKRALHMLVFLCPIYLLSTAISCAVEVALDLLYCRLSLVACNLRFELLNTIYSNEMLCICWNLL